MATEAELAILLKLHDELSGNMKKPTEAVNTFGASLKRVGEIATGFLAAQVASKGFGLLKSGITSSIAAARQQAQAEEQLAAVLRSTAGAAGVSAAAAKDMSEQFQKTTRIEDDVVLSAENMLLTFTNIKANIFPETTKAVLDMATAMKGGGVPSMEELKTVSIQVGKALQDPVAGVTALQKVGVRLTEQQKEQVKAMVEAGDVMGAQKIILAELNTEFGGSAEAMTPFERNMDKVNDTINNTKETIGFFITGGLNKLAEWLSNHGDDIKEYVSQFAPAFNAVKTQLTTQIAGIVEVVKGIIKAVEGVADLVSDVAHGRWGDAWNDLKRIALAVAASMLNGIAALFGQLPNLVIAAMNEAIKAWNSIQGEFTGKINLPGVGNVNPLSGADLSIETLGKIEMPKINFDDIVDGFNKVSDAGKSTSTASVGLASDFTDLGDAAKETGKTLKEALLDALGKVRSAASELFSDDTVEMVQLQLQKALMGAGNRGIATPLETQLQNAKTQAEKDVIQGWINTQKQQTAQIDQHIKDLENEHKIMQLRLKLADQTLLTEGQLRDKVEKLIPVTFDLTGKIKAAADSLSIDLHGGISSMLTMLSRLETAGGNAAKALEALKDPNLPSHALGLDYVPYDNYVAKLHKGERVMTAADNAALMNGGVNVPSGGPSINITINVAGSIRSDQDIAKILMDTLRGGGGRGLVPSF